MLTGHAILCMSSIDWDFIWQGHQQIMSMLAANGNQVLFVENTGARRPTLRDMPRLRSRLRNWWHGTKGFRQERPNLFVYAPVVLPFPYAWIARVINRLILMRAITRWMRSRHVTHPVVWTFLPTALTLDIIKAVDPKLVVYHCVDDFASSSAGIGNIRRTEDRLLRDADLVFVTSEKLRQRAREFRATVELFPSGVDFQRFEAVHQSGDGIPGDLEGLPRPVVGYVGGLHQWVDQELLADTARRLPAATFALVGPAQCDLARLEREPNIRLLGSRSHDDVPRYIQGFDVALVPYRLSDYTANVYPAKVNEYLAMGVPVVATGIPEILRFNESHGDVVAVAETPEAMSREITRALQATGPGERAARIAVARENSWDARVEKMSALMEAALAARQAREERWDATLRRVYRNARRRAGLPVAAAVVAYLIAFHTPALWIVAEPLRVVHAPREADAIVVFAGGAGESAEAGGGYQERVRQAVDLYQAGYAPTLIFSSGFIYAFREAEVMRGLALDLGIPREAIVLEEQSGNTYQMVANVRDIARREGLRRVLLVSSPYHMRRALATWRRQAPEIDVIATPGPSRYYSHGNGASLQHYRGIGWEYAAILFYWSRGWL